jgi:hypothetical protein
MTTISVWVLLFVTGTGAYQGQIDNIATREECERLYEIASKHVRHAGTFCMEVRKAKQ